MRGVSVELHRQLFVANARTCCAKLAHHIVRPRCTSCSCISAPCDCIALLRKQNVTSGCSLPNLYKKLLQDIACFRAIFRAVSSEARALPITPITETSSRTFLMNTKLYANGQSESKVEETLPRKQCTKDTDDEPELPIYHHTLAPSQSCCPTGDCTSTSQG